MKFNLFNFENIKNLGLCSGVFFIQKKISDNVIRRAFLHIIHYDKRNVLHGTNNFVALGQTNIGIISPGENRK